MTNTINDLITSLEGSSTRAKDTFGRLDESQFNWKPSAERWSVAECISHLQTANETYFPMLEEITAGTYSGSFWQKISPFSGFFGRMLLKSVSPETTKKVKTASIFKPAASRYSKNLIDDFHRSNDELISFMHKIKDEDLSTIIASPVNVLITYSLDHSLKIMTYHEVRHLNQAENVTKMDKFPKN